MSNLITIEDLMRATYTGNYALQFMGILPPLAPGTPGAVGGVMIDQQDIMKADDPFLTTKVNYFNPIYGQTVIDWLNHEADIWKLLKKTTYQAKGDATRIVTTDASNFYGELELSTTFGDTDIPVLAEVEFTDPAVMYNFWDSSMIAQMKSMWQDTPRKNVALFLKDHMAIKHPSDINGKLCFDTDTPAQGGGNNDNFIESIDRVCSDSNESALLSAPTDNDIYGFDRSAGEAEAYVDLNSGTLRDLSLDLLDDAVADIKQYSRGRNFIAITTEGQLNTIEALEGVKQRFSAQDKWKVDSINGVNTRNGAPIGFAVSSIVAAGMQIPIFTSKDIHAESGGGGNIYILDTEHIEIRVALPTVYMETQNVDFLVLGGFNYKYMFMTVAQLIADQFNVHAAIKYLN